MVTTRVDVQGMTCEHCVRAVTDELKELPGVAAVEVVLATGAAEIRSGAPLHADDVRAAVEEAGYRLAS